MRIHSIVKKGLCVALAMAMVVTGVAVTSNKAEAKKVKNYTSFIMYADKAWKVQANMEEPFVSTKNIKGKKGTQKVNLSLNRSKLDNADFEIADTAVLCVDIVDLMKDYKPGKVKISNVAVKVDGKKVAIKAAKLKQGYLEKEHQKEGNYKYRLEIYNDYGKTKANPCAPSKKFAFKKSLAVSFKITIK